MNFKVGIYLRLSQEDENKLESQSISNQRDYIMNYIKKNNLTLIDEYIDDGFSGTNFDRKGFERLINDIEKGRINMVITKDTSRLGRNISQSLYYSTEYFQEKNVRYVALADGIDTFDKTQNTDMLMFKAFYNEMYVKDISTKIKATLNTQKKNGKFMGGIAPYGYKRDLPYNKHRLIIDEETSIIVKDIYNMFINGFGINKIANILTNKKIPIPSIKKNLNRGIKSSIYGIWRESTISSILTNPTYKGDLTQGKEYKISYKSKKRRKNKKEDWIIVKNSCPAIIEENIFNLAQNIYNKNKNKTKKSKEYLFRGFLFCKECGHSICINNIKWKKGKTIKSKNICYCNYYKKYSKYNACTPHKIDYNILENTILKELKKIFYSNTNINNLITLLKQNNNLNNQKLELEKQIMIIKNNIKQQNSYIDILYEDKLKGIIDEKLFKRQYQNLISKIKELKEELKSKKKHIKIHETKFSCFTDQKYQNIITNFFNKPNRKLLATLIDKIIIDENKNINIYYKFKL